MLVWVTLLTDGPNRPPPDMFRNPRQTSLQDVREKLLPSVGRAPTPPNDSTSTPTNTGSPYFGLPHPASSIDASPAFRKTPGTKSMPLKNGNGKISGRRQNQSILNFFGKQTDKGSTSQYTTGENDSLFFEDTSSEWRGNLARKTEIQ
jgi:hypothetical protein